MTCRSPAAHTHVDPTSDAWAGQLHCAALVAPATEYRPVGHAAVWAPPAQYELGEQKAHCDVPTKPGLHTHWLAEVAPGALVLLLGWHATAAVAPEAQNEPIGHVTAVETPGAQKAPAGQVVATPFWQKVPAGHVTGAEAPGWHTAPLGHAVALAAPAGQ